MKPQTNFLPEHERIIAELTELAAADCESFRLAAAKAYQKYTPQARSSIQRLETDTVSAYMLFTQWHTSLRPVQEKLRANSDKTMFSKEIAKYLLLDIRLADARVRALIKNRQQEIQDEFLHRLYPVLAGRDKFQKARLHAATLLSKPDGEIEALKDDYIAFLLYSTVASAQFITVTDSHAPWPKRRLTTKRVVIERKKLVASERNRLRFISERLEQLKASYGGMFGQIMEKEWDLVAVISLRNQYEKRIQALSDQESQNPLKRLVLFEKVTKQFRDEQVSKLAQKDPDSNSLAAARSCAETTDTLLLQIFDLTNEEKNQLLVLAKEARDLEEELAAITENRMRRQQLLQSNLV